ncbi:MAG: hypothetical protein K0Q68_209 [Moraxellaceae bacterium]|jgi:transglutaminase-like putative cysteine protease|nr:hypothetical protein [Moraxellaceae bacterium]
MNRRQFLASGCALATVSLLGVSGCSSQSLRRTGGTDGQGRPNVLRYGFTLENPGGTPLLNQALWFYVPLRQTGRQRLHSLSVSRSFSELADGLGNSIVRIDVPQLPPFSSLVVGISAELEMLDQRRPEPIGKMDFLKPEPMVESDAPEIAAQAAKLMGSSPLETAKGIYEWVRDEMRYSGFVADDLGSLRALRERRGDCTEYAYLVCALARACGIPARPVGGYVVGQNTILKAEEYHNWAELHIDGRWEVVDAQKQQFLPARNHYAAFEVISAHNSNQMKGAHRYRVQGDMRVRMS